MQKKILITGSEGLIGSAVRIELEKIGYTVIGCDIRALNTEEKFDFRNAPELNEALARCEGVVHLGAVSRVVWGEKYPDVCRNININGMRFLTQTMLKMKRKIWLIFASSREVFGTPARLPCPPDAPFNPENTYAKTKIEGENIAHEFHRQGGCAGIIRFSNVFGSINDYPDRVVPAFTKAAASGGFLRLRGGDGVYDFTPLADAAGALVCFVRAMSEGVNDLPPINVVTGRATSLREIADMALTYGSGEIITEAATPYYPAHFQGDPEPARQLLGWKPEQVLEDAVGNLVRAFQNKRKENYASSKNYSWLSTAL